MALVPQRSHGLPSGHLSTVKDRNVSYATSLTSANCNPWEATLRNPPTECHQKKLTEDERARVEFQHAHCHDLTVDLLAPFAEITEQLEELAFDRSDRMVVLTAVKQVTLSLERQRDGVYEDLGKYIRGIATNP